MQCQSATKGVALRDKLEGAVVDFIRREGLLTPRDGLHLVALSGGADSVALLRLLLRLGYRVEAVHCNFRLRGDESDRDEQFCRQLCAQHGITIHVAHFDTHAYAELHHVSIEMAARQLRYGYFRQLLRDLSAADVCVAHHEDDAVETLLMNLMRGSGIHGLTGIRPRNDYVVRPLLCLRRADILRYLESLGQDYVTDSSNLVADVVRNKLRLRVIPLLNELFPSASDGIMRTANWVRQAELVYDEAMRRTASMVFVDGVADISLLSRQPSAESVLFEVLRPLGFPSAVIAQVADTFAVAPTGTLWASATHELLVDRGRLLLQPVQPPLPVLRLPEPGTYLYHDDVRMSAVVSTGAVISRSPDSACLDAASVQFPLELRPWREGDRFCPLGMTGSRLVSDFLTDGKVSLFDRRRQLVVTDASQRVVWLVGRRPDHRFRVTPSTSQTLKLTIFC